MINKLKNLRPFDPSSYDSIDLDRLVMYATVELKKLGIELSLENIIAGAFILFPEKFSLIGYPEFPDATRVEKSLWRCKGTKRKWIGGKTPHGYIVTDRTRMIALQTAGQISSPSLRIKRRSTRLRRKESILREVTDSTAYEKYLNGDFDSISEAEFCYILQCTLDSSKDTLRQNFISLKQLIEDMDHTEALKFMKRLEQHFCDFLED